MEWTSERYRPIRRLGAGGTGTVYQAVDRVLGRTVAVKVLHATFSAELLQREGQSLARLNGAGVVVLHDLVEADGPPYLVMEYVDGCNLDQWIAAQNSLEWEQALDVFAHVARSIAAAHAQGVLHCDIKPANVLLSTDGEIKVTDFTLAHLLTEGRFEGPAGGSADWAAPEQWKGGTIDRRTDVYGLGALLHYLVERVDSLFPAREQVDALIARATADDMEERFGTVAEMLDALPVADGAVTRIAPSSRLSQLTRVLPPKVRPGNSRRGSSVVAVLAAALVGGSVLFSHIGVNAAAGSITLPNLAATQEQSARLVAHSLHLRYHIERIYSSLAPAGTVIDQRPAPGAQVDPHDVVTLVISRGPRPVIVPDLTDMTQAQAEQALRRLGLKVSVQTADSWNNDPGLVIGQSLRSGSKKLPGTLITLTVSTKPWWKFW
jgi:serine/threonine-protein kinase